MVSTISRYSRCLAAVVEVSEPSQRCVGPVEVFGLVDLVELLESIPSRSQPGGCPCLVVKPLGVGFLGFRVGSGVVGRGFGF